MRMNEPKNQANWVVTRRIRSLAVATGCFIAVGGSSSAGGLYCPIVAGILVLGAIVQPHSPRAGKWLMWAGASLLTLLFVPFSILVLPKAIGGLRYYHDYSDLGVISHWVVSLLLLIWCDTVLVIDTWRIRGVREVAELRPPGDGEWLVCLAALGLSLWLLVICVLGVSAYRRIGGLDILLMSLALGLLVVLFDVALAIKVVKMWRTRRIGKDIDNQAGSPEVG